MNIVQTPSPNYSGGRWFGNPTFIVIHSIVGTMAHADRQFFSRGSGVSAHYAVDGDLTHQYVQEKDTAWHAGKLLANQRSIGIESAGGGKFGEATEATYATLAELVDDILKRYNLPLTKETVRPHRSIVATQCPTGINMDKLFALVEGLRQPKIEVPVEPPVVPVEADTRGIAIFPITVTITVPVANVRTETNTTSKVYTRLYKNNSIQVFDRVAGEVVNGSEVWLKTKSGNWVHESVTNFKQVLQAKNWR